MENKVTYGSSLQKTAIILASLLWGLVSACEKPMTDKSDSQVPIRVVAISVQKSDRDAFFEQLKKFSDKHAFAIRIAPVRPDGEHFIVQMWREDIKGIGVNSIDPAAFEIGFYENSRHPVSAEKLDTLLSDLKNIIGEVKGVSFSIPAQKR